MFFCYYFQKKKKKFPLNANFDLSVNATASGKNKLIDDYDNLTQKQKIVSNDF